MRWVDRGPEPGGVVGYARQFTQGWIRYFRDREGARPVDDYWREFRPLLGSRTNNICWYCERKCDDVTGGKAPTVDHFQPLSRFPQLAYKWSNWVFSCRRCNGENKQDKWPTSGYVDPCAPDVSECPEQYFDYDGLTGEILPKKGLSGTARRRALDTIDDLGLNKLDVRYYRLYRAREFLADLLSSPVSERQALYDSYAAGEYAGTTRMVVEQLRQGGHI